MAVLVMLQTLINSQYHDLGAAAAEFSAGALPGYLQTLVSVSR